MTLPADDVPGLADLLRVFVDVETVGATVDDVVAELIGRDDNHANLTALYGYALDARRNMDLIEASVARAVVEVTPDEKRHDVVAVPGGGVVKISTPSEKVRYDGERVVGAIAAGIANEISDGAGVAGIVTADGVLIDTPGVIERIVRRVAEATGALTASFTGWRKTTARDLGVDLDRYATKTRGTPKARIEGRPHGHIDPEGME